MKYIVKIYNKWKVKLWLCNFKFEMKNKILGVLGRHC